MGRISAAEILFISVNHNITLVGKLWLIVMVLLRVLVLLLAGYPLYQDEQERFVCNTIQPGCANVCYDLFSPVSLFRFWLVQLVAVCLPYAVFVVYVVHKVAAGLTLDPDWGASDRVGTAGAGLQYKNRRRHQAGEHGHVRRFTGAYVLHLLFRILLEAGFGAAHYYLFGFGIPRRFLCQQAPCTTQVDCYVSRPTEKTVMLDFMLGTAGLSLVLNAVDLVCAVKRSVGQKGRRKMLVEKMYEEEERYFLSPAGGGAGDAGAPPARDLAEPSGSFRKRGASRSSSVGGGPAGVCLDHPVGPRGPPDSKPTGADAYPLPQEEGPEADGSEVALCPPEPMGTPRSIRVSKRGRLKPPPPPRRDLASAPGPGSAPGLGPAHGSMAAAAAAAVCTRRVGQYTLVELTSGGESGGARGEGQEKRSEWV